MNAQLSQQLKTNELRRQPPVLSATETLQAGGSIELHAIEDSASIQRALSVVINAVAAGTLDPVRAKVLLYGLQIASANARRVTSSPKAEEVVRTAEKTAGGAHTITSPATVASKLQEPQAACVEQEKKNEDAAATVKEDQSAETETETPAQPVPYAGQVRIPPSCFSPANGYSSNVRDRLLAVRQRSESRSVV
jgi:hypothetical protein